MIFIADRVIYHVSVENENFDAKDDEDGEAQPEENDSGNEIDDSEVFEVACIY